MNRLSLIFIGMLLLIHGLLLCQETEMFNEHLIKKNTVVAKLKPEYRHLAFKNNIIHSSLNYVFTEIEIKSLNKIFPEHKPPAEKTDKWGHELVDISLIYSIEYETNISISYIIKSLKETNLFEYVEPYYIPELLYTPNDPNINNQYYLNNIRAYDAWDICKGDTNYVVGIVDTGYEFNHPDLVDAVKYNYSDTIDGEDNDNDGFIDNYMGWDFGECDNNPQYPSDKWHGVHVSGIAGATADNNFGMAGVGFNTKLLPVKAANENGDLIKCYESVIYASYHADVINCSWGGMMPNEFARDIVNYVIRNRGKIVVAAAGNSNNEMQFYPASYKDVLCVAGTTIDDTKWDSSSYYDRVDISAPSNNIYSTVGSGNFFSTHGTSMAAPMVAGAAALVWSYYPDFHPLQILHRLKQTADDSIYLLPANAPYIGKLGTGRLNMYRALTDPFKPALSLRNVTFEGSQFFIGGDTMRFIATFINYLGPTDSLIIKLRSNSPYVEIIDSVFVAGVVGTMDTITNAPTTFSARILPNVPLSHNLEFIFYYEDSNYTGKDYYFYVVNLNYLDLDTNNITTTITSKGTIGYNDNFYFTQGQGFKFDNSSLLACGSPMFGYTLNRISDNAYGFGEFDTDLIAFQNVSEVFPPQKGHQQLYSIFTDEGAGTGYALGIKVLNNSYAWNDEGHKNYIVVEYDVINTKPTALSNIYIGFFADWDLNVAIQNRGKFNQGLRMGYIFNLDSSLYTGIQLLTERNMYHYSIDIDGIPGGVKIDDGFSSLEKYQVLTTNRPSSGSYTSGNDVAHSVSSGPHTIMPYDTVRVAFAIHAGRNYYELTQSAENALSRYHNNVSVENYQVNNITIYPNPFNNNIELSLSPELDGDLIIKIYSISGQLVYSKNYGSDREITISAKNYSKGFYVLETYLNNIPFSRSKIIKN